MKYWNRDLFVSIKVWVIKSHEDSEFKYNLTKIEKWVVGKNSYKVVNIFNNP